MTYTVLVGSSAQRSLSRLSSQALRRLDARILRRAEGPYPPGVKRLQGKARHLWRIRVGDYRVVYHVDDAARIVRVVAVGLREHVYG